MAEPAHKEPTMEEILSSIRKIIADDDAPAAEAADSPAAEEEFDVFEATEETSEAPVEDLMATEPVETEEDVLAAISASMDEFGDDFDAAPDTEAASEAMDFATDEDEFSAFAEDDFDGVDDFADDEPELETFDTEDTFELVEEAPVMEDLEPEPAPEPKKEAPMSAKPAPLTDTATVTAAAGSLGKLLSNVEFGQDAGASNTLEALVREMLRPMLKDWLDENLPAIVEKQVEAEVQRIARMAG